MCSIVVIPIILIYRLFLLCLCFLDVLCKWFTDLCRRFAFYLSLNGFFKSFGVTNLGYGWLIFLAVACLKEACNTAVLSLCRSSTALFSNLTRIIDGESARFGDLILVCNHEVVQLEWRIGSEQMVVLVKRRFLEVACRVFFVLALRHLDGASLSRSSQRLVKIFLLVSLGRLKVKLRGHPHGLSCLWGDWRIQVVLFHDCTGVLHVDVRLIYVS